MDWGPHTLKTNGPISIRVLVDDMQRHHHCRSSDKSNDLRIYSSAFSRYPSRILRQRSWISMGMCHFDITEARFKTRMEA